MRAVCEGYAVNTRAEKQEDKTTSLTLTDRGNHRRNRDACEDGAQPGQPDPSRLPRALLTNATTPAPTTAICGSG
jgi:hypothetical protein